MLIRTFSLRKAAWRLLVNMALTRRQKLVLWWWRKRNMKRRIARRFSVHPINRSRKVNGECHHLMHELLANEKKFVEYLRMTPEMYNHLLELCAADLEKKQTNFGKPISPNERLVLTLRHSGLMATPNQPDSFDFQIELDVAEDPEPVWRTSVQSSGIPHDLTENNKQEPPTTEESPDQPSAVHSTVQPMSDSTSGSLPPLNTSHRCRHCSASFPLFGCLKLHIVFSHGEKLHTVSPGPPTPDRCHVGSHGVGNATEEDGVCRDRKTLDRRKDNVDAGKKRGETRSRKYECDVCEMSFPLASELKSHKLIHSGLKPFVCDVCDMAFTAASILKSHKLIHTGRKMFVCDVCDKAFTRVSRLNSHKRIHSGERPFVCSICNKAFVRDCDLKSHGLTHTEQKSFVCDVCDKAFARPGDFNRHKLIHTGERLFAFHVCYRSFAKRGGLKRHKETHTRESLVKCPHCDSDFSMYHPSQEHTRSVHVEDRSHDCDTCGEAFTTVTHLTQHKRIHTGDKPFMCPDCGGDFPTVTRLTQHKRIHTGDKPFTCTDCGEAFTMVTHLTQHKRIHTGDKPFMCSDCGKSFSHPSALKKHRLTHTGEKSHSCPHCAATFVHVSSLNNHVRIKHL